MESKELILVFKKWSYVSYVSITLSCSLVDLLATFVSTLTTDIIYYFSTNERMTKVNCNSIEIIVFNYKDFHVKFNCLYRYWYIVQFCRILISFSLVNTMKHCWKISTSDLSVNIKAIASAVAMSDFVVRCIAKQPQFLHSCWQQTPQLADCEDYRQRLQVILANADNSEMLYKLIRQF